MNPFDSAARRYDRWFETAGGKAIFEIEKSCIRRAIGDFHGRWLEVGVGSGRFAEALGTREGIDPSREMLLLAARRGIHVVQGVGEALPYRDLSFDGVTLITALCFVDDQFQTVSECYRVLNAEGILAVGIVPSDSSWGKSYARKAVDGHPIYSKAKFRTCHDVVGMCSDVGLDPSGAVGCLFTLPDQEPVFRLEDGINEQAGFVVMRFRKRRHALE